MTSALEGRGPRDRLREGRRLTESVVRGEFPDLFEGLERHHDLSLVAVDRQQPGRQLLRGKTGSRGPSGIGLPQDRAARRKLFAEAMQAGPEAQSPFLSSPRPGPWSQLWLPSATPRSFPVGSPLWPPLSVTPGSRDSGLSRRLRPAPHSPCPPAPPAAPGQVSVLTRHPSPLTPPREHSPAADGRSDHTARTRHGVMCPADGEPPGAPRQRTENGGHFSYLGSGLP